MSIAAAASMFGQYCTVECCLPAGWSFAGLVCLACPDDDVHPFGLTSSASACIIAGLHGSSPFCLHCLPGLLASSKGRHQWSFGLMLLISVLAWLAAFWHSLCGTSRREFTSWVSLRVFPPLTPLRPTSLFIDSTLCQIDLTCTLRQGMPKS